MFTQYHFVITSALLYLYRNRGSAPYCKLLYRLLFPGNTVSYFPTLHVPIGLQLWFHVCLFSCHCRAVCWIEIPQGLNPNIRYSLWGNQLYSYPLQYILVYDIMHHNIHTYIHTYIHHTYIMYYITST